MHFSISERLVHKSVNENNKCVSVTLFRDWQISTDVVMKWLGATVPVSNPLSLSLTSEPPPASTIYSTWLNTLQCESFAQQPQTGWDRASLETGSLGTRPSFASTAAAFWHGTAFPGLPRLTLVTDRQAGKWIQLCERPLSAKLLCCAAGLAA